MLLAVRMDGCLVVQHLASLREWLKSWLHGQSAASAWPSQEAGAQQRHWGRFHGSGWTFVLNKINKHQF